MLKGCSALAIRTERTGLSGDFKKKKKKKETQIKPSSHPNKAKITMYPGPFCFNILRHLAFTSHPSDAETRTESCTFYITGIVPYEARQRGEEREV